MYKVVGRAQAVAQVVRWPQGGPLAARLLWALGRGLGTHLLSLHLAALKVRTPPPPSPFPPRPALQPSPPSAHILSALRPAFEAQ